MSVEIRLAEVDDIKYLIKWLSDPLVSTWFPMSNNMEIMDAATNWMSYSKQGAVLTAIIDKEPCGITNLYIQPYKKLAHQCLFAIIVASEHRNKGIGTLLLKELIKLSKEKFKIEILHLEVYDGNPAKSLYERLGFEVYGFHKNFLKEGNGKYRGKYLMQKVQRDAVR